MTSAEFAWGVATSSHQVEGDQPGNDWTDWEDAGRIHDGTRSGAACEWWRGRAEEDLARAAELGVRAIRMSLEWSRIEPREGELDRSALDRYAAILARARSLGLEPFVTLHHFTLPRWVAADGGFASAQIVPRFARYATYVGAALGGHARFFATLNEPNVLAFMGYAGSAWPPGRGSLAAGLAAMRHALVAHAEASRALRSTCGAAVGLVLNLPAFDRLRPDRRRDRAVARAQDWAFGGALLASLAGGRLVPPLGVALVAGLAGSCDWLGLNYYGRYRVRFDARAASELFGRRDAERTVHTAHNDWGEVFPEGLTRQLLRLGALGVPLYVTENGLTTHDDAERARYLRAHVQAVRDAISRGADVRGYFVWSLVDNFEWAEGWSTPFGLFALDRASGARTARPSAAVYREICGG